MFTVKLSYVIIWAVSNFNESNVFHFQLPYIPGQTLCKQVFMSWP